LQLQLQCEKVKKSLRVNDKLRPKVTMIEVAIKCVCKKNDHWEASAMTHVGGGAVGYAQICTKKGSIVDNWHSIDNR
jgi:hypothetical protein